MRRIIRFHGDGLYLLADTVTDVQGGSDFTFLSRRNLVLLRARRGATTRCLHAFEVDRLVSRVLILKMSNGLLVGNRRGYVGARLLPFQVGPSECGQKQQESGGNEINGFHGWYSTEDAGIFPEKSAGARSSPTLVK